MGCSYERDANGQIKRVLSPKNGKPSLLYEQIKRNLPDDYEPDVFVKAAYKAGLIRSLSSKDEIALALWGKIHTPFERVPESEGIPPLKPGYVRLYRGETDALENPYMPGWLAGFLGVRQPEGVHFTESLEAARRFNEQHGSADGRISYIDVPEGEADRYRSKGADVELEHSFLLPEALATERVEYRDQKEWLDGNGEPMWAAVRGQLGLERTAAPVKRVDPEGLLRALKKEGVIKKEGERYVVSKESSLSFPGKNPEAQNASRIAYIVERLGLPKEAVKLRKKGEETVVEVNAGALKVSASPGGGPSPGARDDSQRTNTKMLVRFLKERFPQLEIEFITEKEGREIYNELQSLQPANRRFKLDFDRVKSFVYKGKVHLIEGRVDDNEVVAEEVLHPFVYTISKEQPELFKKLLAESKKDFPQVHQRIQDIYLDKAGFTEYDREQELVAQVLSQVFTKEHAANAPASLRSLLKEFIEWFAQLVRDLGAFLGGKGQLVIDSGKLSANMSLTDIARMLNTYDSQFLVNIKAPEINFRISPAEAAFQKKVMDQANELQKEVLKSVLHPPDPVTLIKKDHSYINQLAKKIYRSVTTAINGKFNDPDNKYELNRLFGNELDHVLESLVLNRSFKDTMEEVSLIDEKIAQRAYDALQVWLQALMRDGTIALPQVVVSDVKSGIAGSIDILLVRPDGTLEVIDLKTSKKKVSDRNYREDKRPVGEGSLLEGEPLSKAQKHGIQIASYKRLLEVMGHKVVNTQTYHIYLEIEGEKQEQKVKGFELEGFEYHDPSEVEVFVKKIIPTEPREDKLSAIRKKLGIDNPAFDDVPEEKKRTKEYQDDLELLRVKVEAFKEGLEKRIDRLDRIKSIASFKPAKKAKQKLSELLMFLGDELSKGRADLAYGQFLTHAQKEVSDLIAYLTDPAKKGTDEYIERVLDADTYLETYRGMVNSRKWALGSYKQRERVSRLQDLLDDAQEEVKQAKLDYVLRMMKKNTSKEGLTDEDWKKILKEGIDISKADKHLGDIDTSTDELVAVAAKVYKLARLRAMSKSEKFKEELYEMGNRLSRAFNGKPAYEMILEFDENGQFTGRYVQEIDTKFWRMMKAKKAEVVDKDGRMLPYRKVYNLKGANKEDIAYNKALYEKRKAWYKFSEAENTEVLDAKGLPTEGMYFKYNQEFIDERAKYEEFKNGRWVRRSGVGHKEYKLYELKYYEKLSGYDKPFVMDEEFTGTLIPNAGSARFVKQQYKEVRLKAGDGTDMRSEKYRKLMTGMDEQTQAMRAFYEFYTKHMGEALEELPLSVQRDMLGKVGRVRGKFIDRAGRSPAFFKAVAKDVGDWFKVRTSARQAMYNEDGTPVNQIPMFYTGGFRNEKKIQELEAALKQLDKDLEDKKLKKADYMDQRKKLLEELQQAENALDPSEVELDLVKNLQSFYDMAVGFGEMQRIEAGMLAVQRVLEERVYKRRTASGDLQREKNGEVVKYKADQSRTVERFKAWMQMTFYSSEELDRSTWEVVAKRLMNVTSALNVGFNGFGPIHNYLMARINTAIETFGGLFYSKEAGTRSMKVFNEEFLVGYVRNFSVMQGDYYKQKRMGSKYEALAKLFHMVREQRLGEGKPKESFLNYFTYGYRGQSMGEYSAQSKSGIAYLMTKKITSEDGKTTLSIYDAYEFDEATQTLKLKDGFKLEPEEQHKITNYIWEMNKQIHGNYAWEDRAMIQKEVLGQMAMQFHKWVYPMYKARFQGHYVDENLGDIEGRYRTIYNLILMFKEAEGTFGEKWRSVFHGMRPDQKKNMWRNVGELSFFATCFIAYGLFQSLADDVDDDDKYLKRLLNFGGVEASRDWKEILFWIPGAGIKEQYEMFKNPFATGTTLKQFADVLYELGKLPIPPYDDAYYTRGPFKGEMKLKKEFFDLVPVMKELNRWATFDNVTSFHIK